MNDTKVGANQAQSLKHLQIDDAIQGYRYGVDSLERLVCRLKGTSQEKSEETERNEPCFIEILEASPARINMCNKRLEELITELQTLLF